VGAEILKAFAALLGILGLIFLLAYGFRRFGLARGSFDKGAPGWKVLGVKSLAPGKQVYVLEIGTRTLLIGSTDKMITPLMEIKDDEDQELIKQAVAGGKPVLPSFKDFLRRAEQ